MPFTPHATRILLIDPDEHRRIRHGTLLRRAGYGVTGRRAACRAYAWPHWNSRN